jgi:DNA-binding transcriptional regulator YdaS (Cro superfamily)
MVPQLTPFEALSKAVGLAGGQSALARICGVSQTAVWKWLQSSKRLPAEHVLKVEAATGISRHLLRPDIYPVEHDSTSGSEPHFGPIMSRRSMPHQSNRQPILEERPAA